MNVAFWNAGAGWLDEPLHALKEKGGKEQEARRWTALSRGVARGGSWAQSAFPLFSSFLLFSFPIGQRTAGLHADRSGPGENERLEA